jgi:hypothetical protein
MAAAQNGETVTVSNSAHPQICCVEGYALRAKLALLVCGTEDDLPHEPLKERDFYRCSEGSA